MQKCLALTKPECVAETGVATAPLTATSWGSIAHLSGRYEIAQCRRVGHISPRVAPSSGRGGGSVAPAGSLAGGGPRRRIDWRQDIAGEVVSGEVAVLHAPTVV